jgi:hypothetical protein
MGVQADFGWRYWNFSGSLAYSRLIAGREAPISRKHEFYKVKPGDTFDIYGHNSGKDFVEFGFGAQLYMGRSGGQNSTFLPMERFKSNSMIFFQYNSSYGASSDHQTASMGYQYVF